MALNFPNSPSQDDRHEENGLSWVFNGTAWDQEPVMVTGPIGPEGPAPTPTTIPHGRFELTGESVAAGAIAGVTTVVGIELYAESLSYSDPSIFPWTDIEIEEGGMSLSLGTWVNSSGQQQISQAGPGTMTMTVPVTGLYEYEMQAPAGTNIQSSDRVLPILVVNGVSEVACPIKKLDSTTDDDISQLKGIIPLDAGDVVQACFGAEGASGGDTELWNFRGAIGTQYSGIGKAIHGYFDLKLHTGTVEVINAGQPFTLPVALGDRTSDISLGVLEDFLAPASFTLEEIFVGVDTAPTGSAFVVDVKKNGTTVLSTLISVDDGDTSSLTSATPPVISTASFIQGDKITVEATALGATTTGTSPKLYMKGQYA